MTQIPTHLSPKQERDRHITEVMRAGIAQFDRLHDLHNCPQNTTVDCSAPLALHGVGRVPDPMPRCNGCRWQGHLLELVMQTVGLRFDDAADWLERRLAEVSDINALPADGGHRFRWTDEDGTVAYDLPDLTRRVRNAWMTETEILPEDGLPPGLDNLPGRVLTVDEWESVCNLLDLLPSVYAERDQARRIAMQLEEEIARR